MRKYIVRKLGINKGAPRVYLEFSTLSLAGFKPGMTYARSVDNENKRLTLTTEPNGAFVVSKKEADNRVTPVIDINSSLALKMFTGLEMVRIVVAKNTIHILPIASDAKRLKRLAKLEESLSKGVITTAGISFGGGVLDHAAHAGLSAAGIQSSLAIANEIDEGLLNHAIEHNDIWRENTIGIAAPMQELACDEAAMSRLPTVDVFCAGIPCSGASQAGKAKRKLTMMEDHATVGHLIASAIMLINRLNPSICVIENVENYSSSASAQILRQHLRDTGYKVQETVLSARDFGCLENRNRWFLVASTVGIDIDINGLAPALYPVKVLADVLDDIGPEATDWRSFDYLKTKEIRDAEKGNSFAMQIVTPESTSCPVLRKGYAKGGSTDPLLQHPSDANLLRQLTVAEHSRIKDVPEHLVAGMNKTDGHALLGQGIAYAPVKALFKRIGESLNAWKESLTSASRELEPVSNLNLLRATG